MSDDKSIPVAAALAAIITVAEVPSIFSVFLPSLYDINYAGKNDFEEATRWCRRGEVNALALSVTIGLAASMATKSWLPLMGSLAMSTFLLYHYESAMTETKPEVLGDVRNDA